MYTFYYAEVGDGKITGVRQFGMPTNTDGLKLPLTMTEYMLLKAQNNNEVEALRMIFDVDKVYSRIAAKLEKYNNEKS